MNEFLKRTLTAIVFAAITIGSIWWCSEAMAVLFLGYSSMALWEYYRLIKIEKIFLKSIGLMGGVLIYASLYFYFYDYLAVNYMLFVVGLLFLYMFLVEKKKNGIKIALKLIFSWFYIVLPFALFVSFRTIEGDSIRLPLYVLGLIWTFDSMAYIWGSLLGKHPIAPKISPKKTWEGSMLGLISTVAMAYVFMRFIEAKDSISFIELLLPVLVVIAAFFGDLFESKLKRKAEVKDSGKLFPSHGGVLDRFDSFLWVVPIIFIISFVQKYI